MKRITCIVSGLMLLAASAIAQTPPAPENVGLALSMQRAYASVKASLTRAAETMPEADYAFKLVPIAEVRTYGQWFGHQADNQLGTCATLKSVPNPGQGSPQRAEVDDQG